MNSNPTKLILIEKDPLSTINNQEITLDSNLITVYHQDFLLLIKKIKNKALLLECWDRNNFLKNLRSINEIIKFHRLMNNLRFTNLNSLTKLNRTMNLHNHLVMHWRLCHIRSLSSKRSNQNHHHQNKLSQLEVKTTGIILKSLEENILE